MSAPRCKSLLPAKRRTYIVTVTCHDLVEWNYGEFEGLTSREIREQAPGWLLFNDGCPGGETPEQVGDRADRIIARARGEQGNVVLFAHGHLLRVLAGALVRIPRECGPPLSPGYRDSQHSQLLSWGPCNQAMELGGRIVAALLSAEIREKQGRIRTPWPAGN